MRTFRPLSCLMALLTLSSSPALARASVPRALVLELPPDEAFAPAVQAEVNAALAEAVRQQGLEVVVGAELAAALGDERLHQLEGCAAASCLAELERGVGAAYVVHGTLGALEGDAALTLAVADAQGLAMNQVRKLVAGRGAETLVGAVQAAVPGLLVPVRSQAGLAPAEPGTAGGLTSSREAAGPPSHALPYALLGTGTLAVLGSAAFGYLALLNQDSHRDAVRRGLDASAPAAQTRLDAWVSTGLLVGGVAAIGAGAYLFTREDESASQAAESR